MIENAESNINNDRKKTYAEIVSGKKEPMTPVSRRVSFMDETPRNEEKENNMINQEECSSHSF